MFDDLLLRFLPPLLPSLAACYFASLMCRLAHWSHRHVHWWFGLFSVGVAGALVVCFIQLGSSLQPGQDSYGMIHLLHQVCAAGSLFAVVPAEFVVWHYRKT